MNHLESQPDDQARRLREGIRVLVRRFSLAERADISCCGMTVAQAATLEALAEGDLRLGELGTRLGITASTLTRNMARLEERGLVKRVADPCDGRAQRAALTAAGRDAAEQVRRNEEVFARSILGQLPQDSAAQLLEMFDQLLGAVRSATESCCPGAYDHLMRYQQPPSSKRREDACKEDEMTTEKTRRSIDPTDTETVVEKVRERYGAFAAAGTSCCGPATTSCCSPTDTVATNLGYASADLDLLPDGANLGLGCGAPLEHLALATGETMLDLGSGAGIDALIASRQVGPDGAVIGVDMTPEMLHAARANAAAAGAENVEFREGRLESLPVEDAAVDAVTSNCVINLVPDKSAVFKEISRVLKPGGRLVISDIVLEGSLPAEVRENVLAYVGCVSGAAQRDTYFQMLAAAGLGDVEVIKDVDFLEMTEKASPAEVESIMAATGISREEVRGIVRSVTYRARKISNDK